MQMPMWPMKGKSQVRQGIGHQTMQYGYLVTNTRRKEIKMWKQQIKPRVLRRASWVPGAQVIYLSIRRHRDLDLWEDMFQKLPKVKNMEICHLNLALVWHQLIAGRWRGVEGHLTHSGSTFNTGSYFSFSQMDLSDGTFLYGCQKVRYDI